MTKVDNFKEFVKKNQVLVTYVKENKMTWQKFYELYDLYGEDDNIWNEYLKKEEPQTKVNNTKPSSLSNIMEMAKNIRSRQTTRWYNIYPKSHKFIR